MNDIEIRVPCDQYRSTANRGRVLALFVFAGWSLLVVSLGLGLPVGLATQNEFASAVQESEPELVGKWICVVALKDGDAEDSYIGVRADIDRDSLTWHFPQEDGTYREQKCGYRIDTTQIPQHFDWWQVGQPESIEKRIYSVSGNTLRWGTNLDGRTRPASLESANLQFTMKRVVTSAEKPGGKSAIPELPPPGVRPTAPTADIPSSVPALPPPGVRGAAASQVPDGFVPLFNGRDLTGWLGDSRLWTVDNGVLRGFATNPARTGQFLVCEEKADDFELWLQFRIKSNGYANSGIQFRSQELGNGAVSGYQADIGLKDSGGNNITGRIFEEKMRRQRFLSEQQGQEIEVDSTAEVRLLGATATSDELASLTGIGYATNPQWHDYHIVAQGNEIVLRVDGVVTTILTDRDPQAPRSGLFALQLYGPTEIEFRNIYLRRIELAETSEIAGWGQVVDPVDDCQVVEQAGELSITVPGKYHDLFLHPQLKNLDAPRVLQSVRGDFVVQVKARKFAIPAAGTAARSDNPHSYVSSGLVVWQDSEHFLRLQRAANGNTNKIVIHANSFASGDMAANGFYDIGDEDLHLRVERRGGQFTQSYSTDGHAWTTIRPTGNDVVFGDSVMVGVFVINATTKAITHEFADYKLSPNANDPVRETQSLFNGTDLTGWEVDTGDRNAWQVDRGELMVQGNRENRGWLITEQDYSDFRLRFEFQLSSGANSGVSLRSMPGATRPGTVLLEIQLQDDPYWAKRPETQLAFDGTGSLYGLALDRPAKLKPVGQWNQMDIELTGSNLRVMVNELETLQTTLDGYSSQAAKYPDLKREAGRIGLQNNANGTTRFRNITITKLASTDPVDSPTAYDQSRQPHHGMRWENATKQAAVKAGLPGANGVLVLTTLSESPARKAGLQAGDIILKVNGEPTPESGILERIVDASRPGDRLSLEFVRDRTRRSVDVTLDEAPDEKGYMELVRQGAEQGDTVLMCVVGWSYYTGREMQLDKAEAARWYRRASESGYMAAQNFLAGMYQRGDGITKDDAEAARWYRRAAEQGYAQSQNQLGALYQQGKGVAQDSNEAFRWYLKSAEQGNAMAQANVGISRANGKGISRDDVIAVHWFRLAANEGVAEAQSWLGTMYEQGRGVSKDEAEAARWYKKAADQGQVAAVRNLSRLYTTGSGVPRDLTRAAALLEVAAEKGNAESQRVLGTWYQNGTGVPQDYTQSVKWLRKAVDQGDADAQYHLSVCYETGNGVPQDKRAAFDLCMKAAQQNSALGQKGVAVHYFSGIGVARNDSLAVEWFRKAAEQGLAEAQLYLGDMYGAGRGVAKDDRVAFEWYLQAAKQGSMVGEHNVGILITHGRGVEQNFPVALSWFHGAADKGHAASMNEIGEIHENGWGVPKDRDEAIAQYRKAAQLGNADAKENLRKLGVQL